MNFRRKRWILISVAIAGLLVAGGWLGRDWLTARMYLLILESEWRLEQLEIEQVLDALALSPGDRVADIGAGTGVFARPLAREVAPGGVVYAVDINTHLLRHIERTAESAGLGNLRTILGAVDDPRLPEPVDLIFFCDTLHHISNRQTYLENLAGYLRPGGRIAIIDFSHDSPHLDADLRYSREELEGWMTAAGYELVASFDMIEDNFFVIYQWE